MEVEIPYYKREQIAHDLRMRGEWVEQGKEWAWDEAVKQIRGWGLVNLAYLIEHAPNGTCHIKSYQPDFDVFFDGCSQCGSSELKRGMKFCPHCGARVVKED